MRATGEANANDLCVLVADDNRDAADTLAMVVRLWGYTARVAYDGAAALAMLDEVKPHVLLVDLGMPQLDGYELARRVRGRDGPRPVLVAVTGYADANHRGRAGPAGFDHFLVKPADLDRLRDLLRGVCDGLAACEG